MADDNILLSINGILAQSHPPNRQELIREIYDI